MSLSELHEQIAREAARFAENELEPLAAAVDEGSRAPDLGPLGAQGLLAPDLPVEMGGAGADPLARSLVLEALARSCASTALAAGVQGLAARLAFAAGDTTLARALATGERRAGLAVSEGARGDDLEVNAFLEDGRRITGEKNAVGVAGLTDVIALVRDPSGLALALARAELGTRAPSVGLRGVHHGPVRLAGEARRLGGPDLARSARDGSRALAAPIAAGIAARALDEAKRYAMLRQQFGRAIARFQGVQFLVAQILTAREGCRGLARALAAAEARNGLTAELAAAAALDAPATAIRAALDAVQVFGGMGYTREVVAERLLRDALALQGLAGPAGAGAELELARAALARQR